MSIKFKRYSKQNVDIAAQRLKKIKYLNLSKKKKSKIKKYSQKDEQLIYAFFLDIA